MSDDLVVVYDERGRELHIEREEWANSVLPASLENAWYEPDKLYGLILDALENEFHEQLIDAAKRLVEIDSDMERSCVVLAIVLMRNGMLDAAEELLRDFVEHEGETGTILTNLAKIQSARGEDELAQETLRHGLSLDPNQDNGLLWYVAMVRDEHGEEAGWEAMRDVAGEPGSWLPQLWLARHYLQTGDPTSAMELYYEAVPLAAHNGAALQMVSGDLGEAGLVVDAVKLVGPLYEPQQHGPYVGMNLVRAHLMAGEIEEGRALLKEVEALNLPFLAEHLAGLERELLEAGPPAPPAGEPTFSIVPVNAPIWTVALEEPGWLLPTRQVPGANVIIWSLADETRHEEPATTEYETDRGRLARSLPLYLAECLQYQTNAVPTCLFPVMMGRGPVLSGSRLGVEAALASCPDEMQADVVVSGAFTKGLFKEHLELDVWDAQRQRLIRRLRLKVSGGRLAGRTAKALTDLLVKQRLVSYADDDVGIFAPPPAEFEDEYLLGLGQLLMHVLTALETFDSAGLWNERGMLETYFQLAEQLPEMTVPKLMAVSGVLSAMRFGSPFALQYKRPLLKLIQEQHELDPNSLVSKVAPLVYRRLDETDAYQLSRDRLMKQADATYREWLERI